MLTSMMFAFMDLRCKQRKEKQLSSYEFMFMMNKLYKGKYTDKRGARW